MVFDMVKICWVILTVVALISVAGKIFSQERGQPFFVTDIEDLLKAGVSYRRTAELIEERGVNFAMTGEVRLKLRRAKADDRVIRAVERAAVEYANRKVEEEKKKGEEEQQRIEDEKRKVEEERRRAEAEKRAIEEAKRKEEEKRKAEEEARRKKEEEERRTEEARRKEEEAVKNWLEEAKRQEETRKKELGEIRSQQKEEKKSAEAEKNVVNFQKATPAALAPPCIVGLRLQFQLDDGRPFTRAVLSREGELCVIVLGKRYYYDKDWVLRKVVERDGNVITKPQPLEPLIEEKWLPFPLSVGQTWESERYMGDFFGRVGRYKIFFDILSYEEVDVPAGKFKAFKIKEYQLLRGGTWGVIYYWYAPEVGFYVKRQTAPDESSDPYVWNNVRNYALVSITRPK